MRFDERTRRWHSPRGIGGAQTGPGPAARIAVAPHHRRHRGYDTETRRGLIVANITGYLASLSSLSYALNYALHDWACCGRWWSATSLGAVHRAGAAVPSHRPGRRGVWLSAVIFSTIFYFIAYLGRETGIQLNYLGTAPVALAILGIARIKLAAAIARWRSPAIWPPGTRFPAPPPSSRPIPGFMDQIYGLTAVSLMAIIFLVVFYALHLARTAQAQTDALLHNIMPGEIAERLKEHPARDDRRALRRRQRHFRRPQGLHPAGRRPRAGRIVALLDELFSAFDAAAARTGIEKIKTIGDAYMAVAGLPRAMPDHAAAAVELACDMVAAARASAHATGSSSSCASASRPGRSWPG
jgi:adenylate cyclase